MNKGESEDDENEKRRSPRGSRLSSMVAKCFNNQVKGERSREPGLEEAVAPDPVNISVNLKSALKTRRQTLGP